MINFQKAADNLRRTTMVCQMNLLLWKNLFRSGPVKILGLTLALLAVLLAFELQAVLLNLPEDMRRF
jgi:hypothetical protein